jgi:glycine cleavage system aminomethyltransferase T
MRERAAMFDLTAFCIFDVLGPGALECVQTVSMRQMDVGHGKVVYTPVLSPSGTFKSDLTVMRLGDEHFRSSGCTRNGRPVVRGPRAGRTTARSHLGVDDAHFSTTSRDILRR